MTDRIPTTTPDATTVEEALMRIRVAAHVVETIAEVVHQHCPQHSNALVQMTTDIENAVETIYPVVQHLLNQQNRRDAA